VDDVILFCVCVFYTVAAVLVLVSVFSLSSHPITSTPPPASRGRGERIHTAAHVVCVYISLKGPTYAFYDI
jgi:hypothetical protein